MINAVKLCESQCEIGKIHITDSIKNHCNNTIECTEAGTIEFDITRGINTTAKGLIKTYCFSSFRRRQNFETLLAQVAVEYNKQARTFVMKGGYNVKKSNNSEMSEITFSDF
jgi:hypothetical protein